MTRIAHCCCGSLRAKATGEPAFVGACHCTECQRRTGSPFGVGTLFPKEQVRIEGPLPRGVMTSAVDMPFFAQTRLLDLYAQEAALGAASDLQSHAATALVLFRTDLEQARSLYAEILTMGVPEKIKLALRGNKSARGLLINDPNKIIRRLVLQNPRITDGEIAALARNKSTDDELIRMIGLRSDWMRFYAVRLGLVTNPRTPLPMALKVLPTLSQRDIGALARSRNVPTAIASRAWIRRVRFRRSSSNQIASLWPKVIGSAWIPWLRPIIRVRLCSNALC